LGVASKLRSGVRGRWREVKVNLDGSSVEDYSKTGTLDVMLKKLAKAIGLIGGAVAVLWAMRDRFVSVATSREPEPPTFRTPRVDAGQSIEVIDGIGPVFATRLAEAGMEDIASLAEASPDSVAEAAGVSGARARSWIEQAQQST
jgi:hypothetical protein